MVYFFKLRFPFLWVLFVFECRSTKLMVAGCIKFELLAVSLILSSIQAPSKLWWMQQLTWFFLDGAALSFCRFGKWNVDAEECWRVLEVTGGHRQVSRSFLLILRCFSSKESVCQVWFNVRYCLFLSNCIQTSFCKMENRGLFSISNFENVDYRQLGMF